MPDLPAQSDSPPPLQPFRPSARRRPIGPALLLLAIAIACPILAAGTEGAPVAWAFTVLLGLVSALLLSGVLS